MSERPSAAVVVPFLGSDADLARLHERLAMLRLGPRDRVVVSDNRDHPVKTPGYARNRGAERASAEWLVFLDADTIPGAGLLDAYFEPPPAPGTAILAGGIEDRAPQRASVVARHAVARAHMSHVSTLSRSGTPYAQTANCAIRRSAFEAAGGFAESARAGEDADLCFRLQLAGWKLEPRDSAAVAHEPRQHLGAWLSQLVMHGSGAAWLERRWPAEFPAPRPVGLMARLARHLAQAIRAGGRGDRDAAAFEFLDLVGACAFELGRLVPNRRPLTRRKVHDQPAGIAAEAARMRR